MGKLFIANTSKQLQQIHYRVAGAARTFTQDIQPGQQVAVYDTPTAGRSDHEHIVEQLKLYGLRALSEIGSQHDYSGLCYHFDKPIDVDAIADGLKSGEEFLEERGLEQRKAAALATTDQLNEVSRGQVKEVTTEIIEEGKKGSDKDTVHEKLSVDGKAPKAGK